MLFRLVVLFLPNVFRVHGIKDTRNAHEKPGSWRGPLDEVLWKLLVTHVFDRRVRINVSCLLFASSKIPSLQVVFLRCGFMSIQYAHVVRWSFAGRRHRHLISLVEFAGNHAGSFNICSNIWVEEPALPFTGNRVRSHEHLHEPHKTVFEGCMFKCHHKAASQPTSYRKYCFVSCFTFPHWPESIGHRAHWS